MSGASRWWKLGFLGFLGLPGFSTPGFFGFFAFVTFFGLKLTGRPHETDSAS